MNWLNKNIRFLIYLIVTYLLIIAFKGYQYASNDVVDVMSYAKFLQDSSLFYQDFYISHISIVIPNERIVFSFILSIFGSALDWLPFVFHLIATLIFLIGLYKISSVFIKSEALKWILILVLLGPLYKFNLGGNELYYNMFIASYVAKVFGVWAVYYFIVNKRIYSYLLIVVSTLIHPTVGAQLFIIFMSIEIFDLYRNKSLNIDRLKVLGIGVYILLGGFYVFLLLNGVNKSGVDNSKNFEIFEFRNAHHFFPQYFPVKSYIIELTLYVLGICVMIYQKWWELLKLSLVIILGILVYLIGIYFFEIPLILDTQWFKSTIWLELFSLIAIVSFLDKKYRFLNTKKVKDIVFYSVSIITIIVYILIFSGFSYFNQKPYRFVYGMNLSQEEDIGIKVKEFTNKDAVFIYPMEFTGFKFYSERSAYIDFKSVVHRRDAIGEWYQRINEIYGVDINTRKSRKDLFKEATINFKNITELKINKLKAKGIRYIVQYSDVDIDLPVVVKNKKYKVFDVGEKKIENR